MLFLQPLAPVFADTIDESSGEDQAFIDADVRSDPALPESASVEQTVTFESSTNDARQEVSTDTLTEQRSEITNGASDLNEVPNDIPLNEFDTSAEGVGEVVDQAVTPSFGEGVSGDEGAVLDSSDDLNRPTPPEALQEAAHYPVYAVSASDSSFNFDREACVTVGDGSYYCSAPQSNERAPVDEFFAAPDRDGDLEIFATLNGRTTQVTFNTYDDAAPFYDPRSSSLVWHRLIGDRYHIISYDIEAQKEVQISIGRENNMEPNRSGEYVVWQQWVNDNWEIMLFDGRNTERLTSSIHHDLAPSVRGEHVIWKTVRGNDQVVSVYDMLTKRTTVIEDVEAGSRLTNPRMVIVYDAVTENGDVVSVGYDPESGERLTLGTLPAELPERIPESEQTGETRALIQNKASSTEQDTLLEGGDGSNGSDGGDEPLIGEGASASSTDVVVEALTPTSTLVIPSLEEGLVTNALLDSPDDPFTLVVPPASFTVESDTDFVAASDQIPDLVIPPVMQTPSQ
jgi:hypothetical protein